jgi:hypothetical protein
MVIHQMRDERSLVPADGESETRRLMEVSPLFPQTARCLFLLLLGTVIFDIFMVGRRRVNKS